MTAQFGVIHLLFLGIQCNNLLEYNAQNPEQVAKYTYDFVIGETRLTEEVIMGCMKDYILLSLLQSLNNRQTDLGTLEKKQIIQDSTSNYYILDLDSYNPALPKSNSMFVMFANMRVYKDIGDKTKNSSLIDSNKTLKSNLQLICTAETDTLEFAQSISSTVVASLPIVSGGNLRRYSKPIRGKYRKVRCNKTLKKHAKSRMQSTYSRRSRKYYS